MLFFDDVAFSWSTTRIRTPFHSKHIRTVRIPFRSFSYLQDNCLFRFAFAARNVRRHYLIFWECMFIFAVDDFHFGRSSALYRTRSYGCRCVRVCVFWFSWNVFYSLCLLHICFSFFFCRLLFQCLPNVQFFKSIVCRRLSVVRWIFARKVFPISEPSSFSQHIEVPQRCQSFIERITKKANLFGPTPKKPTPLPSPSQPSASVDDDNYDGCSRNFRNVL